MEFCTPRHRRGVFFYVFRAQLCLQNDENWLMPAFQKALAVGALLGGVARYAPDVIVHSFLEQGIGILRDSTQMSASCDRYDLILRGGDPAKLRDLLAGIGELPRVSRLLGPCLGEIQLRSGFPLDRQMEFARQWVAEVRGPESDRFRYRPYQRTQIPAVVSALGGEHRWISVAAPMQTGKTTIIGPVIRKLAQASGSFDTLILTAGTLQAGQIYGDLLRQFSDADIGFFRGKERPTSRIVIGNIYVVAKHLDQFNPDHHRLVVLDEAVMTQCKTLRRILVHLGLGEEVTVGRYQVVRPIHGESRLLGFSGTGLGLTGYHCSARLDLLTAIEEGWVRDLEGRQVSLQGNTVRMRGGGQKMVWWRATPANAKRLARLYHEEIHQNGYRQNLIFAPSRAHEACLLAAFKELYGPNRIVGIDGKLSKPEVGRRLKGWREGDYEALVSIRMLCQSVRGNGAGAAMHTYETTSPEFFAGRTGRGWGVTEEDSEDRSPYFVLEVRWGGRQERGFVNLATLFGLKQYPRGPFRTTGLRRHIDRQRTISELEEEGRIAKRRLSGRFDGIPALPEWRGILGEMLDHIPGGVVDIAERTGIDRTVLEGYFFGFLPTRRGDIEALSRCYSGGEEGLLAHWVAAWRQVGQELVAGLRTMRRVEEELVRWAGAGGDLPSQAKGLHRVLVRLFPKEPVRLDTEKLLEAFQEAVGAFQKEGKKMERGPLGERAHEIYCHRLSPEAAKPSVGAVLSYAQGKLAIPEIEALLLVAVPKKRKQTKVDYPLARRLFLEVADALMAQKKEGRPVVPYTVAKEARRRYLALLPAGVEPPALMTFQLMVTGAKRDKGLLQGLKAKGVQVEGRAKVNRALLLASMEEACQQLAPEGAPSDAGYQQVADLAWRLYCDKDSSSKHPKQSYFRSLVGHQNGDAEVVTILQGHGLQKRVTGKIDLARRQTAFEQARELLRGQTGLTLTQWAKMAHQVYLTSSPPGEIPPSLGSFRGLVQGQRADRELLKIGRAFIAS